MSADDEVNAGYLGSKGGILIHTEVRKQKNPLGTQRLQGLDHALCGLYGVCGHDGIAGLRQDVGGHLRGKAEDAQKVPLHTDGIPGNIPAPHGVGSELHVRGQQGGGAVRPAHPLKQGFQVILPEVQFVVAQGDMVKSQLFHQQELSASGERVMGECEVSHRDVPCVKQEMGGVGDAKGIYEIGEPCVSCRHVGGVKMVMGIVDMDQG